MRLVPAKLEQGDLPVRKHRVVQKALKFFVGNRLDLRIDVGGDFVDLGEQVRQFSAPRKIFVIRTIFGVFERGIVGQAVQRFPGATSQTRGTSSSVSGESPRRPLNSAIFE